MATLEVVTKKHTININSSSSSSSHGHALFASSFSFDATSTSSSHEWFIEFGASYHMSKDKAIFYALNECNTKKIFVGDDRSLNVVGFGTIQVDNGNLMMSYVFQVFPATFYQYIKSLIQVKVKPYSLNLTKL
jgi:hypothetical protein